MAINQKLKCVGMMGLNGKLGMVTLPWDLDLKNKISYKFTSEKNRPLSPAI